MYVHVRQVTTRSNTKQEVRKCVVIIRQASLYKRQRDTLHLAHKFHSLNTTSYRPATEINQKFKLRGQCRITYLAQQARA
jgi:hypothetical protein